MAETVKEHCKHKDCRYRAKGATGIEYCKYMIVTGKPRGCDISDCDKYVTGKVKAVSRLEGLWYDIQ